MSGMAETRNLGQDQLETVVSWFCHHMPAAQRGALMAEYPLVYEALFPGTRAAVLQHVEQALAVQEQARRESTAAHLDATLTVVGAS